MPVSKKAGKLYFTQQQYELARRCSVLEYARQQGYALVREGSYYRMAVHDSMNFAPDGRWFWNSRGLSGGAIEFLMHYEGKTLVEAVLILAGENVMDCTGSAPVWKPPMGAEVEKPKEEKTFVMPQRSPSTNRLYAYLCQSRGLDSTVIREMIAQGILYESVTVKKDRSGEIHNACFVTFNYETGDPCGAFLRGMNTFAKDPFQCDVYGSNGDYGWLFRGSLSPPETVYVFEAAIDAASFVSLNYSMDGRRERPYDCLSLGGLGMTPLENYLKCYPGIQNVCLALDTDKWGLEAAQRFRLRLQDRACAVWDATAPLQDIACAVWDVAAQKLAGRCKDWNELLKQQRQAEQQIESRTASAQPEP